MISSAAYCRTCGAVCATCSRYWSPRRRKTSRNRTLRWPASIMYSTAEATSPDIGPPGSFVFSMDISQPRCREVHSRSLAASNVDLSQRSKVSWRWRGDAIGACPGHRQFPGQGQNDRSDKETDNSVCECSANHPDEDDECGRRQAAPHHERFQDVVEYTDDAQEHGQHERRGEILVQPDPDDHRKQDDCRADLHDWQNHNRKCQQTAAGTPRQLEANTSQQRLDDCDPNDALGYRPDGRPRQLKEMFALLGHDAIEKAPSRRHELRAVGKEKASQRHRQQELERSNARVARKGEQDARKWLKMRSHLTQGCSNVVGRLSPELVKLRTDERPILDALRRRWNHQVTSAQTCGELPHPLQGAQAKPGRRPDDDSKIDDGEDCRREPRATAEKPGKDTKDGIERDGEHDTPDQDRHERTDQNERPVDQESEQSEPDRKLDDVVSGQILAKRFQRRAFIWERACGREATCRSRAIVLIHIKQMHPGPGLIGLRRSRLQPFADTSPNVRDQRLHGTRASPRRRPDRNPRASAGG